MNRFGIRRTRRRPKGTPRASQRIENQLRREGFELVAGLDEVGRGAWAGPVVAGAVILPHKYKGGWMFDSKNLSEAEREETRNMIVTSAVTYAVGLATVEEINNLGLTSALKLAYVRALKQLDPQPHVVLLDGLPLQNFEYEHRAVVDADQKSKTVAAASIIAKQHRDHLMIKLSPRYPAYAFHEHKGYGTEKHQQAILEHGILPIHRMRYGWLADFARGVRPQTRAARRYFDSV